MANNIAADLQRSVILDAIIRGFKRRITPILSCALVAKQVKPQGDGKVVVRYYPLDTTASKDWDSAEGYVFDQDSNTAAKSLSITGRKYKGLKVSSDELNDQPDLDPAQLLEIKGEKLAEDVVNDIFSLVKIANFGAAVSVGAASAFDSDDVADLRGAANTAMWPVAGRSLILNADFDTALFKDKSITNTAAFGSAAPIQDGTLPNLLGFGYGCAPSMPDNGENLAGFIAFYGAILAAFAPVTPAPAVRAQMIAYDEIPVEVVPGVTIMLQYKNMGDAFKDFQGEIVECRYGKGIGETAALKRIEKAA